MSYGWLIVALILFFFIVPILSVVGFAVAPASGVLSTLILVTGPLLTIGAFYKAFTVKEQS